MQPPPGRWPSHVIAYAKLAAGSLDLAVKSLWPGLRLTTERALLAAGARRAVPRPGSPRKDRLMSLPSLLQRLFVSHKPELLADQVATRSRPAVWDRVSHRMHALSGAEARGYIRARGAKVIERETDRLMEEDGGKAAGLRQRI